MRHIHWLTVFLTIAAALAFPAGIAEARQGKSLPPRKETPPPPAPDLVKWTNAYERAREPIMLVWVGWATGEVTASGVGAGLFNLDRTGFAQALRSEFERQLLEGDARPEFVDQEALADAMSRLGAVLEMGREDEAVRLLAHQSGADIVILIELYGTPGSRPQRVMGRVLDMSRGRVIARLPTFKWDADTDAPGIREYAGALAQRFVDDFDRAFGLGNPFTLNLLGVRGIDMQEAIRNLVERVPGVTSVRPRRAATINDQHTGASESVYALGVRYDDDALRLAMRTKEVIESLGEFYVEEREIIDKSITLRVFEREVYVEESLSCEARIQRDGSTGEELRRELVRLYDEKNRPAIVVLVNRRPTVEEAEESEVVAGGGPTTVTAENLIVLGSIEGARDAQGRGDRTAPSPRGPERGNGEFSVPNALRVQANLIETRMYGQLGVRLLNMRTVDADEARRILESESRKQSGVYRESEVTRILARQNIADIAIFGMGNTTFVGGRMTVTYTFRAVDVRNAALMGTAIVHGPFDERSYVNIVEQLADEAVGRLICDLMASWKPPSHVNVTIKQAQGPDDFEALEDQIKKSSNIWIAGSESADYGPGTGIVRFRLDYACSFSELKRELQRVIDALPYTLITESSSDSAFTFRIQRDA